MFRKFLPVLDIFEDEIGGVRIIIESQSGGLPNEDMKMSSAPSFRAPGGHIEGGTSQVLKKHVFTATMLAQHVASELRMRLWTLRSLTDRNTPSRLKIDLGKSGYNGFFVITDITDFGFLTGL